MRDSTSRCAKNHYASGFIMLALLVLNSGCYRVYRTFNPPHRYMQELPSRDKLVGRWTLSSQSLARMKSDSFTKLSKIHSDDHLIILRDDGSCYFKTYWSFHADDTYIISEGRWELKRDTFSSTEELAASVSIILTPEADKHIGSSFWIVSENGGLILWKYLGDPDEDKYIDFIKAF